MKYLRFIAIDPGATGALAYIDDRGRAVAHPIKTVDPLDALLDAVGDVGTRNCICFMEKVGGYIKGNPAPGSTMFNFGENYGTWKGLCRGLGIRLELVTPQKWQKGVNGVASTKGQDRKHALQDAARLRFPGLKPTLATSDALMLASYAEENSGDRT